MKSLKFLVIFWLVVGVACLLGAIGLAISKLYTDALFFGGFSLLSFVLYFLRSRQYKRVQLAKK